MEEVPTTDEGPRMVRVPPEPDVDEWSGCETMAGMTATPLGMGGSCQHGTVEKGRGRLGLRVVVMWLGGRGNGACAGVDILAINLDCKRREDGGERGQMSGQM